MENKIKIVASSKYVLSLSESDSVRGGRDNRELCPADAPASGCACCICSPDQSASGGKKYASSYNG